MIVLDAGFFAIIVVPMRRTSKNKKPNVFAEIEVVGRRTRVLITKRVRRLSK